jgi:hypothetical protein
MEHEFEALGELFTTTPTTFVGVAALLEHFAAPEYPDDPPNCERPSVLRMAYEQGPDWSHDFDDQILALAKVVRAAVSS